MISDTLHRIQNAVAVGIGVQVVRQTVPVHISAALHRVRNAVVVRISIQIIRLAVVVGVAAAFHDVRNGVLVSVVGEIDLGDLIASVGAGLDPLGNEDVAGDGVGGRQAVPTEADGAGIDALQVDLDSMGQVTD